MITFSEHPTRFVIGWALIFLGIIGLFLPILQGILFIATGFVMLENEHMLKIMRKLKAKWKKRHK